MSRVIIIIFQTERKYKVKCLVYSKSVIRKTGMAFITEESHLKPYNYLLIQQPCNPVIFRNRAFISIFNAENIPEKNMSVSGGFPKIESDS